jgi:hypothetical protein
MPDETQAVEDIVEMRKEDKTIPNFEIGGCVHSYANPFGGVFHHSQALASPCKITFAVNAWYTSSK